MTGNDLQDLLNARKVLGEMRYNWAKAIAAGYKRGDTENAIKSIIEIQQAMDVIDRALEESEEVEEEDHLEQDDGE